MSNPSQANNNMTQRQIEIIRRLAAREAERRQQAQENKNGKRSEGEGEQEAGPSKPNDASLLKSEQLQEILRQEKAKNDLAWARVRERIHRLDRKIVNGEDESAKRLREKRLELDYLDFEVDQVEKQLSRIGIQISTSSSSSSSQEQTDEILALLTRSILASSVEQYEKVNEDLQQQINEQQEQMEKDVEMLNDFGEVLIGLRKRKKVLEDRMNKVDFASIEGKLLERVDGIENELSYFLQSLIEISSKIFDDEEGLQQAQLRHLIDSLINKAWDTPIDPYVDVSQDYLPAISAFVLRANIAIEHPRDSHRIRLIDFHRMANS